MFSSIRGRLWLSYAALTLVALGIVSGVLTIFLLRNPYIYRQTTVRLIAAENLILREPRAAARLDLVAEALEVRVLVFSSAGDLTSDSDDGAASIPAPSSDARARKVAVTRDAHGQVWLYSRSRLQDGRILLVAAPRPRLLPVLGLLGDELWRPVIQGGVVALLLALILAYVLAGWIASPLQQLMGAARAVAAGGPWGDSSGRKTESSGAGSTHMAPVAEHGPREVRGLIRAFNAMLDRVYASQRSQKEFVANVSHELKTPLTSIQGFSQAIMDGTADSPATRRQAAEIIHMEAARMHRMAVDLLDLARLDAGTAELRHVPVQLGRLLRELDARLQSIAAASGIRLDLSVADDLPAVAGDSDRLTQVFTNLIDNALKYTPRGGRVSVTAVREPGGIQVSIIDTGTGISAKDIPHIFDRFYQADSAREGGQAHGTGLGLAIAREMTEAHGGRISVRSTLGQGAEFVVHLPSLEGSSAERGAA